MPKKPILPSFQEIFRFDQEAFDDPAIDDINGFISLTPSRTGQYSISYSIIKTSFIGDDDDNNSTVFERFEDNRQIILDRLLAQTTFEYDTNSQEVLVPAFVAAYSNQDINKIDISPFPYHSQTQLEGRLRRINQN